jgi:hypothetical protein
MQQAPLAFGRTAVGYQYIHSYAFNSLSKIIGIPDHSSVLYTGYGFFPKIYPGARLIIGLLPADIRPPLGLQVIEIAASFKLSAASQALKQQPIF